MYLKRCNECGSRMLDTQGREHLAVFHPSITTIVQEISEKLTSFPTAHTLIRRKFPCMDCRNLCAAKLLANRLIENLTRNDSKSFFLIQELWEKITTVSHGYFVNTDQRYCHLCDSRFSRTNHTFNHLMLCHPECVALVQFLRCHPLSKLNIPNDVIVLRQTFVELEQLPSHLYQECITKGYVTLKEKAGARSVFDAQPNSRLKKINAEVMKKIQETNKEYHANLSSKWYTGSHSQYHKNASLPNAPLKIIHYGVEDLIKDRLKKSQEVENNKVSIQKNTKEKESYEQLLQYVQKNSTSRNEVSVQESIKKLSSNMHLTLEKDNSKKEFDELVSQDVEKNSIFKGKNEFPLQRKANRTLFLNSEKDIFEEDINKSQLQGTRKHVTSEVKKKVQEKKNSQKKLILEKNSFKEVDEAILQDAPNYSLSLSKNKVLVQKAIPTDVRKSSKYRDMVPARKRRFKMSALPLTSEEDSFEDGIDKPIIPRFFAADLEVDKVPVQKRKKKREMVLLELDKTEAEADEILFRLLQKFYIFQS